MWHFHGILALGLPIKWISSESSSGKSTGRPQEKGGEMSWHSWCWCPYFLPWASPSVKGQTASQSGEPYLSKKLCPFRRLFQRSLWKSAMLLYLLKVFHFPAFVSLAVNGNHTIHMPSSYSCFLIHSCSSSMPRRKEQEPKAYSSA